AVEGVGGRKRPIGLWEAHQHLERGLAEELVDVAGQLAGEISELRTIEALFHSQRGEHESFKLADLLDIAIDEGVTEFPQGIEVGGPGSLEDLEVGDEMVVVEL